MRLYFIVPVLASYAIVFYQSQPVALETLNDERPKNKYSINSEHENYESCNIEGFFQAFLSKAPSHNKFRSSSETITAFSENIQKYYGEYLTQDISCEIGSPSENGYFSYDNSKKSVSMPSLRNTFLQTSSSSTYTGDYVLSNIYGTSYVVKKYSVTAFGITLTGIFADDNIPDVELDSKTAEKNWPDLSFALVGRLQKPYISIASRPKDPSFESRTEINTTYNGIVLRPKRIVVWNKKTKSVLKVILVKNCNDSFGTFGTCFSSSILKSDENDKYYE